jgi:endo-1,4-beta-xylanase
MPAVTIKWRKEIEMLRKKSLAKRKWGSSLSLLVVFAAITSLLFPTGPYHNVAAADPVVVAQYDFEDGTEQGWVGRGDAVLEAVTEAAHTGSYSLKTTGRTAGWHGPGLDVLGTLEKGAVYEISGCVRLVTGESATTIRISMARTPVGEDTAYEWIVSSEDDGVTDADWVCLQGQYSFDTDVEGLTLYVESTSDTAEFYLDDVTITMVSPPPTEVVAEYDFEDGSTQGWAARGDAVLEAVTEAAHTGSYSLKTTGRTAGWHGPGLNVLGMLGKGAVYEIGGCVRLVTGESATTIRISMARTPVGEDTAYEWIVSSEDDGVTDAEWVLLQGQYSFDTDVEGLTLYVESTSETAGFYLDDVTITMVSPPPGEAIAEYDFEDGTEQGWVGRGDAVLEAVTEAAHTGSYSLKTTGRTAGWHGASVNVLGLLEPGVTYDISGCVRLVAGQPASRLIISMQRTPVGEDTVYEWIVRSAPEEVTDAEWVCLQGQYLFSTDVSELILYVESDDAAAEVEFYLDDVIIVRPSLPPIQDIASVYETLSDYFLVGAALEPNQLDSARHTELLTRHFNSLTAENVMKPGPIQPTEGNFDWEGPDKLVQFARDNGMFVHGHTLQWHQQAADWMFLDDGGNPMEPTPENKALLLQRLEDHIRAVAGRYKDDVNVWDVVNEVVDPDQPDCMRRSPWYEITGMDYITTAFYVAREVAPDATLIINDYSTTNPQKRACLYNLVDDLLAQGVPVDGVGMQMHVNIENPSAAAIEETIETFAELGVEVHITELDMSIYTNDTDSYTTVPEEILIRQGYRYKDIFDVFRRQADHIGSVTFWGMADDHTWLKTWPITRLNLPLLFDEQLQAKYAYWGIVDPSQLPVLIQQLNVPKGRPIINGWPEFLWNMLPWIQLQATENFSASFQTRWSEKFLYLFVDVEDSTRDLDDAVEVFIDENNAKTASYESDDRHYTFKFGERPPHGDVFFFVWPKPGGYRLEAMFRLQESATTDRQIGFDLRVTDGSQPSAPISWNDPTHSQDTDTSKFGTLTLIDAVKWTIARKGTPVIDGIKDAVWARTAEITTDTWVEGSSGATAKVKMLWDDSHLYIFATVTDPLLSKASANPWEQDSIEVFVDQNNAKTPSYQSDDGQYRVNYDNEQSFGGSASADNFTTATQIVPDGYVVEAAIALDAIQPQRGTLIGFDFQVNDDGQGDGTRSSVVTWNDPTGLSYLNTSRFGVLWFMGRAWW